MGGIFGGSKSKQTSSNQAYGTINQAVSPALSNISTGTNAANAFLSGDMSGFNQYKNNTGFDFQADQGSRGITGNAAAGGLLRSGGTGKALANFGANINQQFADNYFQKLLQQAGLGMQAGQLLAGAGQTSTGTSKSKPGLGGLIGGAGSLIAASDRRLKKNIVKLYEKEDGLGIYKYNYVDDSGPFIGVMVDEVAKLRPHALGPVINGYGTVDYAKLNEVS